MHSENLQLVIRNYIKVFKVNIFANIRRLAMIELQCINTGLQPSNEYLERKELFFQLFTTLNHDIPNLALMLNFLFNLIGMLEDI